VKIIEIVNLIATLGAGEENPSPSDREVFLKFLNLAYFEIYRKTFLNNPFARCYHEIVNCVDGTVEDLQNQPIAIRQVYNKQTNKNLEKLNSDEILKEDPGLTMVGNPIGWYYFDNSINLYPNLPGDIPVGIRYYKDPETLTIETLESSIPFPAIFHPILVDGACYYLYQDEGGFKDGVKMKASMDRWSDGQSRLGTYLLSISGKNSFTTFNRV
jgi:hypothetical protein